MADKKGDRRQNERQTEADWQRDVWTAKNVIERDEQKDRQTEVSG